MTQAGAEATASAPDLVLGWIVLFVIPAKAGTHLSPSWKRGNIRSVSIECQPCVYILASRWNGTLYTGVTSDLLKRIHEHRNGTIPGFTQQYNVKRLMWFERHDTMEEAIIREKRIKEWRRAWKISLIEERNPHWDDLAIGLGFPRLPD